MGREARTIVLEAAITPAVSTPMPWQSDAWQHLREQLAREQLPHALLLSGVQHTGKSHFAMALARLLLCPEPVAGHNCGTCHACEMGRAGSHGDFRWLQPEGKSRVIKIDQIREVVNFGNMTAGFGRGKVVVLAPAERMNPNAANALLKSLEEPAQDMYLLLVCHRPQGLPATIRSRCQQLRLPSPTAEQSLDWLDQLTGKREDSAKLLDVADGRPLLAEKIFHGADMKAAAAIPQALEMLRTGQVAVPQVAALFGQLTVEDALAQFTAYLQRSLRAAGQDMALGAQSRRLFGLLDELNRLKSAVESGANPNPQILLEALLARFQKETGK